MIPIQQGMTSHYVWNACIAYMIAYNFITVKIFLFCKNLIEFLLSSLQDYTVTCQCVFGKDVFDVIYFLTVNGNAALFHTVSGAVKNLTIESDCSFTARQWVGSFALYLKDGGKLDNCTNLASVTCKPSGTVDGTVNCFAGGLVALTDGSTWASAQNQIVNCRNDGSVTVAPADTPNGNFASAGGHVGGPANVRLSQSVNTGAVSNEASMQNYYGMDGNCTGGLVGQIDPNSAFGVKTEIIGCVNTGKVTGGCNVGGVAGKVNNKNGSVLIESCRNLGNVHATNTADVQNAGGILGRGYAEIYNCDSAGTITGETTAASAYRGALAGYLRR